MAIVLCRVLKIANTGEWDEKKVNDMEGGLRLKGWPSLDTALGTFYHDVIKVQGLLSGVQGNFHKG